MEMMTSHDMNIDKSDFLSISVDLHCPLIDKENNPTGDMTINKSESIAKTTIISNTGMLCSIPILAKVLSMQFADGRMKDIVIKSKHGRVTYQTIIDGEQLVVKQLPSNNVINLEVHWGGDTYSRTMPTYEGYFKGYVMKMYPKYDKTIASQKNISIEDIYQLLKVGKGEYYVDYTHGLKTHLTAEVAFAITCCIFHMTK